MYAAIIVGTGFGGISAAINLQERGIDNFIMLERRGFAGGTWLQNTYPGAAVDVQSPLYSLSKHPYPWSHLFAKQSELADYTQQTINKHALMDKIKLNSNVEQAKWCQDHWLLTLQGGETLQCKAIINATGPLSNPVIPQFAGLDEYQGEHFHCNDWQHNIDLSNKRVAIIGSGASSVQIVPAIIDKVSHLHVLQRTPHWILPRPDWAIPSFLRKFLAIKPIYALIRWFIYVLLELRVVAFKYSKTLLKLVAQLPAQRHIRKQVHAKAMQAQLTPNFTIGCKRILVSNTYYPALQKDNCTLHCEDDALVGFTKTGLNLAKTGHVDADVVVFATGYSALNSMVSYQVVGRNKQVLSEQWKSYPRAYLGTSMPNFPNFFVVTGPNTGIGHTSAIFVIESQMKYIMQCMQKLNDNSIKAIEPTQFAESEYTNMVHSEMQQTVWSYGGCSSWYQNEDGKVIAMFPGFSFTFRRMCKNFTANDHTITR